MKSFHDYFAENDEINLIKIRIRQLQYDKSLAQKRGQDTKGEDYAGVRNEIKKLREKIKSSQANPI
jgi:hypothetical protein